MMSVMTVRTYDTVRTYIRDGICNLLGEAKEDRSLVDGDV